MNLGGSSLVCVHTVCAPKALTDWVFRELRPLWPTPGIQPMGHSTCSRNKVIALPKQGEKEPLLSKATEGTRSGETHSGEVVRK